MLKKAMHPTKMPITFASRSLILKTLYGMKYCMHSIIKAYDKANDKAKKSVFNFCELKLHKRNNGKTGINKSM